VVGLFLLVLSFGLCVKRRNKIEKEDAQENKFISGDTKNLKEGFILFCQILGKVIHMILSSL